MFRNIPMQEAIDNRAPRAANIELAKVVREYVPVITDETGGSFGNIVDEILLEAAKNGEEIQSFTIHMEKEQWAEFAQAAYKSEFPSNRKAEPRKDY